MNSFADTIRRWRELGARYQLAVAQLNFVTMVGVGSADARRAADEARETFTTLRAEPFIRLLDRALSADRSAGARRAAGARVTEEAESVR